MDQIGIAAGTPSEAFALLERVSLPPAATPRNVPALTRTTLAANCLPYGDDVCQAVLHILAYAEISCNLSRYDGIKFGFRAQGYSGVESLYTKTRTQGFTCDAKLAVIMGCMLLSQDYYTKYYEKALKVRHLIKESLTFDEYDVLEVPPESHLAVLCGLPSLTVNGTQLIAGAGQEELLCKAVSP
jgi:Asp-tRNA(Asn)/Glu-tRNA(Gln) amidotransferase A subunit family amidase